MPETRERLATTSELREELEIRLVAAMAATKDLPEASAVGAVVDAWIELDANLRTGSELPSAWKRS